MSSIPSSPGASRISLWANPIPLECGVVAPIVTAVPKSTSLSLHMLKKLLKYAKSKGKLAYPMLSYSVWQRIACSKLDMTDDQSWLYFETFDTVSNIDPNDRLKMLSLVNKCSSNEELGRLRKQVMVDTTRFMLLLFLQNATRLSLKSSIVTGDEWPSPEADHRQRNSMDNSHFSFIKSHLLEILQLIAEPGGSEVSLDGLAALDFLIIGTVGRKSLSSLTYLACHSSAQAHSGYSESTETFSLPALEQWIRSKLVVNPFSSQAMRGGASDRRCSCYRSNDVIGRLLVNSRTAPLGSQTTLLHRISKQTLAKEEEGVAGSVVHIQNCRGSYIYLLAPLKCVMIEKCARCVIVLGAVERAVTVTSCAGIKLVTAGRRLHINSSSQCTFHLLTATRPVVFGNCHTLSFAPYNTHYPRLNHHLVQCGLLPTINYWDQPISLVGKATEGRVWSLMEPREFVSIEIPFKLSGDTKENPCVLPPSYRDALATRRQRIKEWYSAVQNASLTLEQQQKLQDTVQIKFQEWLYESGRKKEIYDLQRGKPHRHPPTK